MPASDPVEFDPLDLALLADERVVWTGRPSPRSPFGWPAIRAKLRILAWACVPSAVLAWAVHVGGSREAGPMLVGVAAVIWLVVAAFRLTITPVRRRWVLVRSRYVLTTRRAIAIVPQDGGRRVTFIFLDSLSPTFSRQQWPDGFGDVHVSAGVSFERVADPVAVEARLVESVLAARRDLPDLGWTSAEIADAIG